MINSSGSHALTLIAACVYYLFPSKSHSNSSWRLNGEPKFRFKQSLENNFWALNFRSLFWRASYRSATIFRQQFYLMRSLASGSSSIRTICDFVRANGSNFTLLPPYFFASGFSFGWFGTNALKTEPGWWLGPSLMIFKRTLRESRRLLSFCRWSLK